MAALARLAPRLPVIARCTLHGRNLHEFPAVIDQARRMGFRHVSFLALDVSSDAFGGGDLAPRRALVPAAPQVDAFERAIVELEAAGGLADGFVLETAAKLRALARHLRASGGEGTHLRPPCDAPWWSSVVETDGSLRPCFFHGRVGNVRGGLVALRRSAAYRSALDGIAADNATCDRCVCPKERPRGLWERLRA
jgi:MoaA/NifB/PqqE/SkfB family radical SAM enzyme